MVKVLIVEDELLIANTLKTKLEKYNNYQVIDIVVSGKSAIKVIEKNSPDVVLMDIVIQGEQSGIEVAETIRNRFGIPVIYTTAMNDKETLEKANQVGGYGFLIKPFEVAQVDAAIQVALGQRRQSVASQQELTRNLLTFIANETPLLASEKEELEHSDISRLSPLSYSRKLENTIESLELELGSRSHFLESSIKFDKKLGEIPGSINEDVEISRILDLVVKELSFGLNLNSCEATIFHHDHAPDTIYAEYTKFAGPQRRESTLNDFSELHDLLFKGECLQFCLLSPEPYGRDSSSLACPIIGDEGILGFLFLSNNNAHHYTEWDTLCTQKMAAQCATAIKNVRVLCEVRNMLRKFEDLCIHKDDLLETVSFELRSPVSNMRMALKLLGDYLNLSHITSVNYSKDKEDLSPKELYLRIAYEECQREVRLIENLLELKNIDLGHQDLSKESISLQGWIPGLARPFKMKSERNLQNLKLKISSDLPVIVSVRLSLERVLLELLDNACNYTPAGEDIVLSVSHLATNEVTITVTNSGVTIPEEELSRIFDKFYRLPQVRSSLRSGAGLGLALVKGLVSKIKGRIQASSSNNSVSFSVTLPLFLD